MREADLATVETRWREAFGEYDEIKRARLGQVARWEWATGERYDPRPLYYQRFPGRGRVLKDKPSSMRLLPVEYGIDQDGRVLVLRHYHELYPPLETFHTYVDGYTEMITFNSVTGTTVPGEVVRLYFQDGRATRYATFKLSGFGPGPDYHGSHTPDALRKLFERNEGILRHHESYYYEGNRVVRIQVYDEGYTREPWRYDELVTYDDKGRVEEIVSVGEDYRRVLYRRRRPGQMLESLAEDARSRLVETIPAVMARASFTEPLYCILLWYREADFYFPPVIIPGFESQRRAVLAQPREAWWQIWNPEVAPGKPYPPYPIDDAETLEVCQRLEQEIHSREAWELGRRTLRQVARELTERDWSDVAPVTPDFVVFAVDHELDDLTAALRASVGAVRVRAWKSQGLIGR